MKIGSAFLSALMVSLTAFGPVAAETLTIPAQTQVYIETDQPVSGKKKHTQEGQIVRATVWRDVEVDGRTVIKAGTPVLVRVDTLKGAKIAGIKGKMTLGAYDTTALDGTKVDLGGGYFKEGSGRIVLTATLAALVFLPLIFIKGKAAELPRGTVFDAYTKQATTIALSELKNIGPKLNLSGSIGPRLDVAVLYDELEKAEKPEKFAFSIKSPKSAQGPFSIDKLNGVAIEPLPLDAKSTGTEGDVATWRGEVEIKKLGKEFKKGINTFEVATTIEGERVAKEVVLDIQI